MHRTAAAAYHLPAVCFSDRMWLRIKNLWFDKKLCRYNNLVWSGECIEMACEDQSRSATNPKSCFLDINVFSSSAM